MDDNYVVFMLALENTDMDIERLIFAFGVNQKQYQLKYAYPNIKPERVMSMREAMFANGDIVPLEDAVGCICRVPTVSCPPAIPIAVPGELLTRGWIDVFSHYGITKIDIVKN